MTARNVSCSPKVSLGIDVLVGQGGRLLEGRNVGLLVHPASTDSRLRPTVDVLSSMNTVRVCALFGPEHGFGGEFQDQESVATRLYRPLGIPMYSLYGESKDSLVPSRDMLEGIDTFVVDLQDIGIRYYTFIYTMSYCMEACREYGVDVVVLDRPNPLGGLEIEGNIVGEGFRSFVGRYPLPVRHGMTIGELALMFNDAFGIGCSLTVVPMKGWQRWMWHDDTGLAWVMPSPNMATLETATVYGGACLVEATNVSEGRGTTHPFELIGAPWVCSEELARTMNDRGLPGVVFRPHNFQPCFHKWSGQLCGGVQIHVRERTQFKPFLTGICLLEVLYRGWPDQFEWRLEPYEFEVERLAVDLLAGGGWLREALEKGTPIQECQERWGPELNEFKRVRRNYLLY